MTSGTVADMYKYIYIYIYILYIYIYVYIYIYIISMHANHLRIGEEDVLYDEKVFYVHDRRQHVNRK